MTWPALMPEEFNDLRDLSRDDQLVSALTSQTPFVVISFFLAAVEDETWTLANEEFMTKLLHWIVQEFAAYRLSEFEAEQVLEGYYIHRQVLENMLPRDVVFHVEKHRIEASRFLYGVHSPSLHAVMSGENSSQIEVGELSYKVFSYVHTFVCTGDLSNLWREPPEVILQVLHQASVWEMVALQKECIGLVARYITPANVLTTLLHAQQFGMVRLRAEMLNKLNEMKLGIEWVSQDPNELVVVIEEYQERGQEMLKAMAVYITRLSFRGKTALNPFVRTLLPLTTGLRFLDLDGTSGCHEELLDLAPANIEVISLQRCPWINVPWVNKLTSVLPRVHRIYIGENSELSSQVFIALIEFPEIDEIDLHNLAVIRDDNLDYLWMRQKRLQRINLSWCMTLTDGAIGRIHGQRLQWLDIAHTRVTDANLQAIAKACPLLQEMFIEDCTNITEEGVITFVRQALSLRKLNAKGIGLSPSAISEIRKVRKGIEFAF